MAASPISRSAGRSATGAAAYRAGVEITDERTGLVHDYTRKGGVMHAQLILPGGGTADRAEFWNGIEAHHKRGDAVLVREVEVSLPTELTAEQRKELAVNYALELADRYGVAADVALHAPRTVTDRELEKDPDQYYEIDPDTGRRHNGNWHAHIMLSACHVQPDGTLGKKAVELDPIHCKRHNIENLTERERPRWCDLQNAALERHGHEARVDHRTLEAQGIQREPQQHLGPAAASMERRTGEKSEKRIGWEQEAVDRLTRAKELGQMQDERRELAASILDLSGNISAAKAERKRLDAEKIEQEAAKQRQEAEQRKAAAEALQRPALDLSGDIAAARAERIAAKVAAAQLRLQGKVVERAQEQQRAAEQARQEQQRKDAEREAAFKAEVLAKVAEQRPSWERMKQEMIERQRTERAQQERQQRQRPSPKRDGPDYEPGF